MKFTPSQGDAPYVMRIVILLIIGYLGDTPLARSSQAQTNVLFICVDDLRPQLHCYGREEMETPNIDRLASQGRLFTRHYVQCPTCGASRCALLTGRYPSQPAHYDNEAFHALPRDEKQSLESLPSMLRSHGYRTVSIGKITHSPDGMTDNGDVELPFAWDEIRTPAGKWKTGWDAFFAYADGSTRIPGNTPATERADVPDDGYPDALIADAAIEELNVLKGEPFFLAVGFFKPHLPFNAPQRYWELYDGAGIPPAPNSAPAEGINPAISLHKSGELTPRYTGLKKGGVVDESEAARLRQAYAACVSYVDAQIGRVLAELDRLGLSENTIVVVWGDHGWHLGEHGIWGKHTLHEVALRSPLIIRVPRQSEAGVESKTIVESVDIFPTLAELCGLSPSNLDGKSFAATVTDPSASDNEPAVGFWGGGRAHTLRTDRYRLTEWLDRRDRTKAIQIELYDHQVDPHETQNISADHAELVEQLRAELHGRVPLLAQPR